MRAWECGEAIGVLGSCCLKERTRRYSNFHVHDPVFVRYSLYIYISPFLCKIGSSQDCIPRSAPLFCFYTFLLSVLAPILLSLQRTHIESLNFQSLLRRDVVVR